MTILQGYLYSDVAQAGTVTIAYPSGFSPDSLDKAGAKACLLSVNSSLPDGSYSLSWGGSSVVVTNLSGVWKGGVSVFISVPDVVNGQGEIVRATTDVTGGMTLSAGGVPVPMGAGGLASLLTNGAPLKVSWIGNSIAAAAGRMAQRLQVLSSERLVTVKIAGHAGGSLGSIIPLMSVDIDPSADIVFIVEGANAAAIGAGCYQEYDWMVQVANYVKSIGKVCIIMASTPRSHPSYPTLGAGTLKYTNRFPWTEQLAALDTGALFVDPWYDWRDTNGNYLPGYSDDNTHPGVSRQDIYDLAAARIWEQLNPFYSGGRRKPYMEVISDSDNAGYSGVDNTAGGVPYGNALFMNGTAGWVTSDATKTELSTASAAPFRGNKMVINFNAGISSTAVKVSRDFLKVAAATKPAAGDVVRGQIVIEITKALNASIQVSMKTGASVAEVFFLQTAAIHDAEMFTLEQPWIATPVISSQFVVYLNKAANITFTGVGSGTNLTVSAVSSGGNTVNPIPIGCAIAGTGITAGTTIVSQTSGTPGGAGVYVTSGATTVNGSVEVLATGVVTISNADLYNLTKLRTAQYSY